MAGFRIARDAFDSAVAHAHEAAPAECCGLLIGREGRIVSAVRARNLQEEMDRFLIDPKDHIEALRNARAQGLEILGFYHSHPHSAAQPSLADLEEASYRDHLHLIVGLVSGTVDVRLYAMGDGAWKEIPLTSD